MRRSFAALALALVLPLPALAGDVTVKPGETLSEIADRLGISMKRLMELNGIRKADHVEVGQKLKVPGPAGSSSRSSGGGAVATGRLTVREGDTLSEIAVRQSMSLNQLIALNGLSKADHVEVGQTLKVTGTVATAAAPAPFRKGANVHVVRSGCLYDSFSFDSSHLKFKAQSLDRPRGCSNGLCSSHDTLSDLCPG